MLSKLKTICKEAEEINTLANDLSTLNNEELKYAIDLIKHISEINNKTLLCIVNEETIRNLPKN